LSSVKKIYVCLHSWNYEGYGEPEAAFSNEKDAKQWVSKNKLGSDWPEYFELEIDLIKDQTSE
jgi:hypothetical protein